jgi:hypothetical protein
MTMEMHISATEKTTTINGVPVRLWEGVTARGTPCKVFIHRIAVHNDDDSSQFDAELQEQMPPALPPIPLSMILHPGLRSLVYDS